MKARTTKKTNAEMSEATIRAMLQSARRVFGRHGYADAPIEEIVQPLKLTKGALYHHFGNKQGLLEAVVRALDAEINEEIQGACLEITDLWERFLVALKVYLEALSRPDNARILLIDAPAVFGISASRRYERDSTIQELQDALGQMYEAGLLRPLDREACAHLINGALIEASLWITEQRDRELALHRAMQSLTPLLEGLRAH